ncbi:DUF3068 domain-containing protein [Nocardioides piscis]|uniref:DUF3068 domain-containing protein n=1 Tax=Nocardioides piscis TaxID=2714938 RepID=A0A6G7YHZ8_9ACTN|nr:DUF3068 domain-containing protein [Nocardioides piscis]QIK76296.1 DUF3068 domain-containing protein [Nocardioides piscis]
MRKIIGWLLLGLGAFLLVTALLATLWVPAQLERTPLDVDTKTYLSGTAEKYNPTLGETEDLDVKATSTTQADADSSDDDVIVWVNTTCLVIDEGDVPECVEADEPLKRLVSVTTDVFATGRNDALAVNGKYRHPGAEEKEGLVNKFPFDTEKKDYPFWDGMLGAPATAEYVGTETLDGLETYKFHILLEEEPVDEIIAGTPGVYSQDKYIWVEPRTGGIVNQEQHEIRELEDGMLLLDLNLAFTDEQVEKSVAEAKDNKSQLNLVTKTVPVVAFVVGLLSVLVGAFLVFAGRKRSGA